MKDNHKKYAFAIGMVGLGCIGAYLEVNGMSATLLWIGCFYCFMCLVD